MLFIIAYFSYWVTSEVLPSIRKHGAFLTTETLNNSLNDLRELARLLNMLADEQNENYASAKKGLRISGKKFGGEIC